MMNMTAAMNNVIATVFVNRQLNARLFTFGVILLSRPISSILGRIVSTNITRPKSLYRPLLLVLTLLVVATRLILSIIRLGCSLLAFCFTLSWWFVATVFTIGVGAIIVLLLVGIH